MAKLNLSPPWVQFYHEVDALFKYDSEVQVIYDDSEEPTYKLKLYVSSTSKADALSLLLPEKKTFGSSVLEIEVIPANVKTGLYNSFMANPDNIAGVLKEALCGNDALSYIKEVVGVFTNPLYYVVFRKEVVQYFTDDLSDINGVRSTLYQEIAKEVFGELDGVYFCTNAADIFQDLPF